MKIFVVAFFALVAVAGVQADCGCLKCSKNLYVASPPSSPLKVIYRGATCTCNKPIPYQIQEPITCNKQPVTLRHCSYRCHPLKVVRKVETPSYAYDYNVQVPVEKQSCPTKYVVGLIARPDRVVLPAPGCREPEPVYTGRGPVFEPLANVEDEDYIYEARVPIAARRSSCSCSCSRYYPTLCSRTSLSSSSAEANIAENIKDIFGDNTPLSRMRRFFRDGFLKPNWQPVMRPCNFSGSLIRSRRGKREVNGVEIQLDEQRRPSDVFMDTTLDWDRVLPQVPLLLFVNAPVKMIAHFHRLRKHLQPVVFSVPTVLRTSGRYFTDFGRKFQRSVVRFTNTLMAGMDHDGGRAKRSIDKFELLHATHKPNGGADLLLFNTASSLALEDLVLVIENYAGAAPKIYFAKIDLNPSEPEDNHLNHLESEVESNKGQRFKRNVFEMDLNGDVAALLREKWGLNNDEEEDLPSAEYIFEEHLNQIPKLYQALTLSGDRKETVPVTPLPMVQPIVGAGKHQDFDHFHPEKNREVVRNEITKVLERLQRFLHAPLEKDLQVYEDIVKLQYLKNTLVADWRKVLATHKGAVISTKMNILQYTRELDKLRARLAAKLIAILPAAINGYNHSDAIRFLVELYKLQLIFARIHEDLGDKIHAGAKFDHRNEALFIEQLAKVTFVAKSNRCDLEEHLKHVRDVQVEDSMRLLETLRKLLAAEEEGRREEINNMARMIQENAHYKRRQIAIVKQLPFAHAAGGYRKELKNLWDLERHVLENEERCAHFTIEESDENENEEQDSSFSKGEESEEEELLEGLLKMPKPNRKLEQGFKEFVKGIEERHQTWLSKTKKLAEILKET